MKTNLIFLFMTIFTEIYGQQIDTTIRNIDVPKENYEDQIYESFDCDEKPSFPGGDAQLLKYISENTRYPNTEADVEGTVYIKFVITKTGEIGQTIVMRTADSLLDEEATRVVKSLPKWEPAKIKGEPVNSWFIVPVKFKML
jgi:periplasmic protein TonB